MAVKLALKLREKDNPHFRCLEWRSCLPFFDNKLAILIHRPKSVAVYKNGGRRAHLGIEAWCGNHFTGNEKFTFMESVAEGGKLVCARCEMMAVEAGFPSSEELVGRHVHLGKVKPIQVCCKEKK